MLLVQEIMIQNFITIPYGCNIRNEYPVCPINGIGIRHTVFCMAGYMYEVKCISSCLKEHTTSLVILQLCEFVRLINGAEMELLIKLVKQNRVAVKLAS